MTNIAEPIYAGFVNRMDEPGKSWPVNWVGLACGKRPILMAGIAAESVSARKVVLGAAFSVCLASQRGGEDPPPVRFSCRNGTLQSAQGRLLLCGEVVGACLGNALFSFDAATSMRQVERLVRCWSTLPKGEGQNQYRLTPTD